MSHNPLFVKVTHMLTMYTFCRVLMLGAGFVTRPTLDILSESGIAVTVGMAPPRDGTVCRKQLAH